MFECEGGRWEGEDARSRDGLNTWATDSKEGADRVEWVGGSNQFYCHITCAGTLVQHM